MESFRASHIRGRKIILYIAFDRQKRFTTGIPNSRFEKLIKYFNIKIIYIRVSSETCMPEVLGVVLHFWPLRIWAVILYFPIPHNALCLPPRFCINYCCEILLGICTSPKSISQLFMQNLGGKHSALWGIGK